MASQWFASVNTGTAPPDQTLRVVRRIVDLLDQLAPTRLDPTRSSVQPGPDSGIEILLAHDSDPNADLEIYLDDDSAEIWSLYAMDEIYTTSEDSTDQWEDDLIKSMRELLSGRYKIEVATWRGHQVKLTVSNTIGDVRLLESYEALWWVLTAPILRRWYTIDRREVDYGVGGMVVPDEPV